MIHCICFNFIITVVWFINSYQRHMKWPFPVCHSFIHMRMVSTCALRGEWSLNLLNKNGRHFADILTCILSHENVQISIEIHFTEQWLNTGWETSAHPLANASENLAGQVENRPGQVEFCIGYIRDYPVRASAKFFTFPAWNTCS